jgi:septum formation protein
MGKNLPSVYGDNDARRVFIPVVRMALNMEPIILASGSPRRGEYLRLLGIPFIAMPSPVSEDYEAGKDPRLVAEELAVRKACKIVETLKDEPPSWVCGADTLISLDGKIYGKPGGREEARRMLGVFQGREHRVISAVALYSGRTKTTDCRSSESVITFAPLSEGEIEWYLDSGEWQDAAGAYKIQGLASCFISRIEGSYSSVVGLPLREFYAMLRDNGYLYGGS